MAFASLRPHLHGATEDAKDGWNSAQGISIEEEEEEEAREGAKSTRANRRSFSILTLCFPWLVLSSLLMRHRLKKHFLHNKVVTDSAEVICHTIIFSVVRKWRC